jgi:L-fucose isomerase-like protein
MKQPFEFVYGDPKAGTTREALADAAAVCAAYAGLRRSRVAVVGSHAPGFIAMDADPFAVQQQFGTQMHRLSLAQFIDRVRGVDESAVRSDVDVVRKLKLPMERVTDDLAMASRFYLALEGLMDEEALDAVALQEWPELPQVLGQWPYFAMSRLTDEGRIITMEGDLDGAILALAGQKLGAGFGYLTDWLEHDGSTIHFWHAGMAPLSWIERPRLGRHFNAEVPLVVDGPLRTDEPMTIARWWRVDGQYRGVAFEGLTVPNARTVTGNTALVRIERDAHALFESLVHAGMPHHVAVFRGRHLNRLRRLMRMLDIDSVA